MKFIIFFIGLTFAQMMTYGQVETKLNDSVIEEHVVEVSEEIDFTENTQNESTEQQGVPLVFAQWWFWVGLVIILMFFKFFVFKK